MQAEKRFFAIKNDMIWVGLKNTPRRIVKPTAHWLSSQSFLGKLISGKNSFFNAYLSDSCILFIRLLAHVEKTALVYN